jgi:two-component system phosphate regulon sensor histidine kinase PhoR
VWDTDLKKIKRFAHKKNRLAVKVGLYTAFYWTPFGFIAFFLLPFSEALLWTIVFPVWGGVGAYGLTSLLITKKINRILVDLEHLANKRFFEQDLFPITNTDELDEILKKIIDTSDTIEKELYRLKKLENYRKEFIGDISHELRTPIFAVQGFIETLLNGALEDPQVNREFLQKAMRNVNRLIHLTNDLMEISKLETGERKIMAEEVPLRSIVQEVSETLMQKATEEKVSILYEDIDPGIFVNADRNQLKQVFINLIENGIKYNKAGGYVRISTVFDSSYAKKVVITVQDSGIGIDKKYLPRVTERFYRIDKSRSRDRGGTGLGLAIVKHIIEAHNEQLHIESEPGKGTRFSFTLQNAASNTI